MMSNLMLKKLSRMPIGTEVELTYEEEESCNSKVGGIVTDNDFAAGLELTDEEGREFIVEYALIRGIKVIRNLETVLKQTKAGSRIRFSYGTEDSKKPELTGVVVDNDGEESLEVDAGGEELILSYSLITSFLVERGAASREEKVEQPEPVQLQLFRQTPEDYLNLSDNALKTLFDRLPREDKTLLSGSYDSFRFGIKTDDRAKMADAAKQAMQIIFREDDNGFYWSADTVCFCGGLLRRTDQNSSELYLVAECFREAALACWRAEEYSLGGAYAILSLLEEKPENTHDLAIILAAGVILGKDLSGLALFQQHMDPRDADILDQILTEAFETVDRKRPAGLSLEDTLRQLATEFPCTEMGDELRLWLEAPKAAKPKEPEKPVEKELPPTPRTAYGVVTRLNWMDGTGFITENSGEKFTFRISDISARELRKKLENCMRTDMGGAFYSVRFTVIGKNVSDVRPNSALVEQARAIFASAGREDRYLAAFHVCRQAVQTADAKRALGEMVRIALAHRQATEDLALVEEAVGFYEKKSKLYPDHAFARLDLAQCYEYLNKHQQMVLLADNALEVPGLAVRQKISALSLYLRMIWEYYQAAGTRELCQKIIQAVSSLERDYGDELTKDEQAQEIFRRNLLPYRLQALCSLDMLEEAEADYSVISRCQSPREGLTQLLEQTRLRLSRKPQSDPEPEPEPQEPAEALTSEPDDDTDELTEEDEFDAEPIISYTDPDGWDALHLSRQEVIDYAIGLAGANRLPVMTAYLCAASQLNPEIKPMYRMVALASNDPLASPDYSVDSLMDTLSKADAGYPILNDCCIAAAYMRASFRSGRGYDFSAKGLRDSIGAVQTMSELRAVCDSLETFRREAGCAIDIYADYRNQNTKRIREEMAATIAQAQDLCTKFIDTPPREGAKFARLLETKKIVFSPKGTLAGLLHSIMARDTEAMEAARKNFVSTYLSGSGDIASMRINSIGVDALIVQSWEEAGRGMQMKRFNATLQGDRRNNLRSNINEIISVIHRWYILSEQDADMTWRTERGTEAYQRLCPQLLEQLRELSALCTCEQESSTDPQYAAGMSLLGSTARELAARLDGSWKIGQEKYFYADFLRMNHVLLDENYLPELTATFCALPDFNILARIRAHAEAEYPTLQEQIDRIYGAERTGNNYGTAAQIIEYLEAIGSAEQVVLPENAAEYEEHSRMYSELRFRSFRENYALAVSCGQILKSDAFCCTLEDTVRYWHSHCRTRGNFGFFTSILLQVEQQIHESARQYEQYLQELLEVLVESNPQVFAEHPGSEESILTQIGRQNFTVAEDWMARIRRGEGITPEASQPEALKALEAFWLAHNETYDRVANTRRPLSALMERRESHNKDEKWGQRLINAWLSNGNPSNSTKIAQLLNLLGWQTIRIERYHFAAAPRMELYEVCWEHGAAGLTTPMHPIAEFGTMMEKRPMYVVCLYGIYDCERLYEKMRTLDLLDGNVLILVDYALGQGDRRKLARKMKRRESALRNKYLVVDRVLVAHLAETCNESIANRRLIALSAPFSYFQPYVVESADTMPPEIFIGRRDELMKVEQPNGVNLIYGGRQLGKSALFKKAVTDIDGRRGQRAVVVDINGLSCAEAARKVSYKLMDLKILPQGELMDNWDDLCRGIERRLRSDENEISYFILMLDEADEFIKDCANNGYRPMVAMKDVQQSLPGRFKYVLAGLHDIVKFNRQVALGNNSVITHMSSLKITPFRTEDARELLTEPLSFLGFSLPSEVTVSQILATCNYFPGLIQLYAKKLIESVRAPDYAGYDILRTPPYVVSDEHLRRVMADKEFVAEIHNKFEATLTLDEQQENYYYPLALLIGWMYNISPSKSGYTAQNVMHHAQDLSIGPLMKLDEERIAALLQELQDLNILRSVTADSYLLASKNFRDLLGTDEEIFEKLRKAGGVGV